MLNNLNNANLWSNVRKFSAVLEIIYKVPKRKKSGNYDFVKYIKLFMFEQV